MWTSRRLAVGSSDWLDGWRNACTTLSYEEKKRNRPQEDLKDKKQLGEEKQNSATSDRKQRDAPLGLQTSAEVDAIDNDRDEAGGRNQRQCECAWTAGGKKPDAKREDSRTKLQKRLTSFKQEYRSRSVHLTRKR
jgi:hypothetical protein